ncbi:transposase [Thalassoglobus sp. JC818]|uniref:transposase n=1 Tax=Thalassoglobus sp. JC818 TaxID=3232136 RepID=UPI0034576794
MLMVDGQGLPLSAFTTAANHAEVSSIETLLDVRICEQMPERLLYDKAADADWLREHLADRDSELICQHRKGRKKKPTQDNRKARRLQRRWIVERTIAWLQNFRRLVVRYENHAHLFEGFVQLACVMILLKRF